MGKTAVAAIASSGILLAVIAAIIAFIIITRRRKEELPTPEEPPASVFPEDAEVFDATQDNPLFGDEYFGRDFGEESI
jgi:hypothetical protein